ncbi:hypothetical protein DP44_5074 [Burkholderia pseudomallei]|nr:hypothetical protein DP44_5074 [Burkholderia pseudomallei]
MSGPGASELNALLARAPSVERVLSSEEMQPLVDEYGRTRALAAVRASLAAWRDAARRDPAAAGTPDDARIAADVRARPVARSNSRFIGCVSACTTARTASSGNSARCST